MSVLINLKRSAVGVNSTSVHCVTAKMEPECT